MDNNRPLCCYWRQIGIGVGLELAREALEAIPNLFYEKREYNVLGGR